MPVFRAVARGDDPGREPSCGAPAHDAYRSNHMRHNHFPADNSLPASPHQSGSGPRGDRSANHAETRIELPGTTTCVPGNPCFSSKTRAKTHLEPSPAILGRHELVLIVGVF